MTIPMRGFCTATRERSRPKHYTGAQESARASVKKRRRKTNVERWCSGYRLLSSAAFCVPESVSADTGLHFLGPFHTRAAGTMVAVPERPVSIIAHIDSDAISFMQA